MVAVLEGSDRGGPDSLDRLVKVSQGSRGTMLVEDIRYVVGMAHIIPYGARY